MHDIWSGRDLASRALANGAKRVSLVRIEWNISGDCMNPYTREYHARPPADDGSAVHVAPGRPAPMLVAIDTRCRRCERCRESRRAQWAYRARQETAQAQRTWFATLTLHPQHQLIVLNRARQKTANQGVDFETLDAEEQFALRHAEISREITLYLKRCRKVSGARMRYLFVAEKHASGAPHYHALIHEVPGSAPVRYDLLKDQWKLGFSQFKLCNNTREASYLCKYLAKSAAARVRASVGYGKNV